jgi:hypothetical protein
MVVCCELYYCYFAITSFCQCLGQLRYAERIKSKSKSVEILGLHRRYFSYLLYREYNLLRF